MSQTDMILIKLHNYNNIAALLQEGGKSVPPISYLLQSQLDLLFSPQQAKAFYDDVTENVIGGSSALSFLEDQ